MCRTAQNVSGAKMRRYPGPERMAGGLPTEPVGSAAGGALSGGGGNLDVVVFGPYPGLRNHLARCSVSFVSGMCELGMPNPAGH